MVELLKQKQYTPFSVEDEVISIWAGSNGYLDDIPVDKVRDFESGLLEHMRTRHSDIGESIRDTGDLDDALSEKLEGAVKEFKSSFTDKVDTVETVAAEEGVPESSDAPASEAGDAGAAGAAPDDSDSDDSDSDDSDSDDSDSDDSDSDDSGGNESDEDSEK